MTKRNTVVTLKRSFRQYVDTVLTFKLVDAREKMNFFVSHYLLQKRSEICVDINQGVLGCNVGSMNV
jgi:hypothetical protein